MAARQAAEGLPQRVHVIETRSVPQGVAALIAHNSEQPFEENVAAMTAAASAVRTAEITRAARATTVNGVTVAEGQPIGIIDGELAVADASVAAAALACARRMHDAGDATLLTLYTGEGEDASSAEALAAAIRAELDVEVEVVESGQPHYPYLIGLE
jgi:dihydroxyacetone kinase-like predicted kinase